MIGRVQRRGVIGALAGACGIIVMLSSSSVPAQSGPAWVPPFGVPAPSFGAREQGPAAPNPWTSERAGFYYVDNTHAAATDAQTYGFPSRPRRTIPNPVAAGSVVEVHGGPYVTGVNMGVGGNGTAAAPIFYRGVGRPVITSSANGRSISLMGTYVVVDGFTFVNLQVILQNNNQAIRGSEMRGMPPAPGGSAVFIPAVKDAVVLGNYIHNNGDPAYPVENDIHGVLVGTGAERVWVVDNEMHSNGGDSVQINSGQTTMARLVYIGRNRMHQEGENAVDIKTAEDVIVSQNICYGFDPTQFPTSGSDGSAIVVNDDNLLNGQNNRIFVIFNEIYNSTIGIRTQAYAYLVGNVIRDIQSAAVLSFGPHDVHVEHNTIYRVGRAVDRSSGEVGNRVTFVNNIVSNRVWDDVKIVGNATGNSAVAYTLFPAPATIIWGGVTFTSLASFMASHSCVGCREGNPRFVDIANNNVRLGAGSPAIGNSTPSGVYTNYANLYGVSLSIDAAGRSRPGADGRWDMGAFESDGLGGPPSAPTNLRIIR